MKASVIVFPGSNCDRDMITAIEHITGTKPNAVWHGDSELPKSDLIVLPGGFSYGDYLRCGAISAHSPIMQQVKKAASEGRYILGVCNGFQILTESGLLPGALLRNTDLKFICKTISLEIANTDSAFTKQYSNPIDIPIAHHDGNYQIDENGLKTLQDQDQIAFRYQNNPNGSVDNIAGILDKDKRILGMMPHPERAYDNDTAGTDGRALFQSLLETLA